MRKNILLKIIVGAASLSIAVPVFAQESAPVPPPIKATIRQEVQNTRQEMRTNAEEKERGSRRQQIKKEKSSNRNSMIQRKKQERALMQRSKN